MKKLVFLLFAIALFSCNNEPAKETPATDTAAAATTPPAEVKPAFVPFNVVIVQHKIKNFDKAETEYFNRDSLRKTFGITHYVIGRDLKDSSNVFVVDKIEDVDKAKEFFKAASAKAAMAKAGVGTPPGFTYAKFVEGNDAPIQFTDGLAISHHVKDFDAWLKVFNADDSLNKANGMISRGVARNLYDSNTVSILFEVSDMAKAKARVGSPELKKTMTDAGVDSPPTIRWYKLIK